ncbi:MAG TPA: hypothetical protein PKA28_15565 [Methylomusa anaerophila]|uniref:Uncharacterized protein n=1 Tax=Methylomusa anaerophila TaxID=1930071 RepID=A0A348AHE9_9FIRM|nr:hypothetical protein [Methylomusa anaerophila]BBB90497.1 hypothetical protein MAMMFC1_01148 [Methylomusa anaerophila]HML89861.1 hypothetical protein [Methylomusa anaerophila]
MVDNKIDTAKGGDHGHFLLKIGDTERSTEEILSHIRSNSSLPIAAVKAGKLQQTADDQRQVQIELVLKSNGASPEELKHILNEYGGCMYQIISVEKAAPN